MSFVSENAREVNSSSEKNSNDLGFLIDLAESNPKILVEHNDLEASLSDFVISLEGKPRDNKAILVPNSGGAATAFAIDKSRSDSAIREKYGNPTFRVAHSDGRSLSVWLIDGPSIGTEAWQALDAFVTRETEYGLLDQTFPIPGFGGWTKTTTPSDAPFQINDAEFIDGDLPQVVLDLPLKLALGRRRDDKLWHPAAMTFAQLISSMSKHEIGPKDGKAFLQGTVIDKERRATAVDALYIVGLDVDCGVQVEEAIEKLHAIKRAGIIYTTHSHLTTSSEVPQSSYIKFAKKHGLDSEPTNEGMRKFFREERHWREWVADTVALVEDDEVRQNAKGVFYSVTHAPIPKFRIILPLEVPYVIAKQKGMSQKDAIDQWKGRLMGLSKMLGLPIDESCLDPSRLFYMPRHNEGRKFRIVVTSGMALDFDDVPAINPRSREQIADDVFTRAAQEMGAQTGASLMIDGDFSLKKWAVQSAKTFLMAELIKEHAADRIRTDNNTDKIEIECPFDAFHSNPGDTEDRACWVLNAHADHGDRGFGWGCQHQSCKGRDRLEFVAEAVNAGWFGREELTDNRYQAFTIDGATAGKRGSDLRELLDGLKRWTVHEDGVKFIPDKEDDGDEKYVPVCQSFDVLGLARDASGDGWSLLIAYDDLDGREHRELIDTAKMHKDPASVRELLARRGFHIENVGRHFENLMRLLQQKAKGRVLTPDRSGWIDAGRYLTPNGDLIGGDKNEPVLFSKALTTAKTGGSFQGQIEAWRVALTHGQLHYTVGACASVAGCVASYVKFGSTPLLNFSGTSSWGKSTGQKMIGGAWGEPTKEGMVPQAKSSVNQLENLAARVNGCVLVLDELKHILPQELESLIFTLAGGSGKHRMDRGGGSRKVIVWDGISVLSLERTVAAAIRSTGKKAQNGVAARCIDYPVFNELIPSEIFDPMELGLETNFGWIGPKFVEMLLGDAESRPDRLRDAISEKTLELVGPGGEGLIKRVAKIFGLLWVSGELLHKYGLLPLPDGESVGDRITAAWKVYTSATGLDLDPVARASDALRLKLFSERGVNIIPLEKSPGFGYRPAVAWYDEEVGEETDGKIPVVTTFYVPCDELEGLSGDTLKADVLAKALQDAEILIAQGKNLRHSRVPINGIETKHFRLRYEGWQETQDALEAAAEDLTNFRRQ